MTAFSFNTLQGKLARAIEAEEKEKQLFKTRQDVISSNTLRGKKMGVWINGKLQLQTRDTAAVDDLAERAMRKGDSVWVAPVGSFVTV